MLKALILFSSFTLTGFAQEESYIIVDGKKTSIEVVKEERNDRIPVEDHGARSPQSTDLLSGPNAKAAKEALEKLKKHEGKIRERQEFIKEIETDL